MNELRKEIGKYFVDISKLVFGGVVLSSILKMEEINTVWVLIVGTAITIIIGNFWIYFDENKH